MKNNHINLIENELKKQFEKFVVKKADTKSTKATEYSLFSGGKRLRPQIMLKFHDFLGGDVKDILPFAVALEMIHTYSLIHDDLPCMDDDSTRRGRKACHVVFGELNALLAGDGLLSCAFEVANSSNHIRSREAALLLATASNYMVIGQARDLNEENPSEDELMEIYKHKTGSLFEAAMGIPAIIEGCTGEKIKLARNFGELFGIYFQLSDDISDGEGKLSKEKLQSLHKRYKNILKEKFSGFEEFLDWILKF